jgi:hypothetical protein
MVESGWTEKKLTAEARSTQREFYFLPRDTGEDRGGGLPLRYGDNAPTQGGRFHPVIPSPSLKPSAYSGYPVAPSSHEVA